MATQQQLQNVQTTMQNLAGIDRERLVRKNLGEESLEGKIEPKLEEIDRVTRLFSAYASGVHDRHVEGFRGHLETIGKQLTALAGYPSQDFIANKGNALANICHRYA